jgi:hypothetical protein
LDEIEDIAQQRWIQLRLVVDVDRSIFPHDTYDRAFFGLAVFSKNLDSPR